MLNKLKVSLLCTVAVLVILTACNAVRIEGSSFKATIIENNETSLLVEPEAGSAELSSADRMTVGLREARLLDAEGTEISASELEVGKQIEIYYSGGIAESYPAQVQDTYEIRLLQ